MACFSMSAIVAGCSYSSRRLLERRLARQNTQLANPHLDARL